MCEDCPPQTTIACTGCGNVLTDEERHYYGKRCETCEREETERIAAWRAGGEDAELDALYDGPPRVIH